MVYSNDVYERVVRTVMIMHTSETCQAQSKTSSMLERKHFAKKLSFEKKRNN